jgi:TonB family protein
VVTDAEIQEYPLMVENRIKGFWVIPDLLSARELKAVVIFGIDKQGEIINLRFKLSSGNAPYDQSVIRAIRKAAPFSPPPQVLLAEEYELTFEPKL